MIGALLLSAAATKLMAPWLTFSRAPVFDYRVTTIEVGTLNAAPVSQYWFRRIVRWRKGEASQVWWTDTKRCPEAKWILTEAAKVQPPRLQGPDDDIVIMGDGIYYKVTGRAYYQDGVAHELSFSSNVDTPLANWIDESLRKLEPCWSKDPP